LLKIDNLFYCPVKSISFTESEFFKVIKSKGIKNDRIFAFVQNLDSSSIKNILKNPLIRKLNNFITLKNTPELNQYNFIFHERKLILKKQSQVIIIADPFSESETKLLSQKINQLINKEKKINFVSDKINPFFDTMPNNSISLINKNSIKDFEKKISTKIEFERFRANIYIKGLDPWEERSWLGKTIIINNIKFLITEEIPRCSATNLRPNTSNSTINLPNQLKKTYDHINMGVFLIPQDNGMISVENEIKINV
tara:strand:- start:1024 stop:1785 length:762 start_codon:yes stop_codon:yes gene_type:complete